MTVLDARPGVGDLLKAWRGKRRMSQFDLSLAAEVSTRHLSYVETGRARPSRAFLLHVAEHLDLPLRARNDLLVAGGYAPVYAETDLEDPSMAEVRHALDLVLAQQEPFPAIVVDQCWNLVRSNEGAAVLWEELDPRFLEDGNVLRASLHPDGMASRIEDLEVVSGHLLSRLRRQAALTGDPRLAALYDELAAYPGVAVVEPLTDHPGVVLPVRFRTRRGLLSFFTTAATFGTAADVTLSELTVECFFPADEPTRLALTVSG
ncbi:MAG TPA: helix-turn-helix transcriptional regulator [Mycobacteriales bacterium]|nr:helix-turn-helix transcriptional regulator [Mycobacteriales bacterium]